MIRDKELAAIVDFILNRAGARELEVIREALKKRSGGFRPEGGIDSLDFKSMAQEMMQGFAEKFGAGADIHGMTRRLVTNMILETVPEIPVHELEVLLDKWVPDPRKKAQGKEDGLPPEALYAMIRQFADYSVGRMSEADVREMKKSMPDWTQRYWDIFSQDTKMLIKELIEGRMDPGTFDTTIRKRLGI
jgi:hypothetical protein